MQTNTKVKPFISNASLCEHCADPQFDFCIILSSLIEVVIELVTIYSWVYLRDLRQLNSQLYIPGLLLQSKRKKSTFECTDFIMEKLFGLILDTVFALKNLVISHTITLLLKKSCCNANPVSHHPPRNLTRNCGLPQLLFPLEKEPLFMPSTLDISWN